MPEWRRVRSLGVEREGEPSTRRVLAGGWDRRRLAGEALGLLAAEGGAARRMVTHVVPLGEAPGFLKGLVRERPPSLQIVFEHAP